QRSFFKAHVIDIELLSVNAIFGVLFCLAQEHNIKYNLNGPNYATEAILPRAWFHRKSVGVNIKDIQRHFLTGEIKTFPYVSTLEHVFYMYGLVYKYFKPLNWIDYNQVQA